MSEQVPPVGGSFLVRESFASRLPSGEWRCIRDNRTEPCGDCDGCREVQGINALSGGSTRSALPATGTSEDPSL